LQIKSVSLISDFGAGSFMLGSVKSRILSVFPDLVFLDIEHNIEPYNSNEAAFILKQSYPHLPSHNICMIMVDTSLRKNGSLLAARFEDRTYICTDNGILSILPEIHELRKFTLPDQEISVKEAFSAACIYLLQGKWNEFSVVSLDQMNQKAFLQPVRTIDRITGTVVYVDRYENVYTNVHRDEVAKLGGSDKIRIRLSRHEEIERISDDFDALPPGEIVAFFDDTGYLQVSINEGNASGLLGLRKGSNIIIERK
jgi:S-adenosylmethionine hydrolase